MKRKIKIKVASVVCGSLMLKKGDVVELAQKNAQPLVDCGAAEYVKKAKR